MLKKLWMKLFIRKEESVKPVPELKKVFYYQPELPWKI